jgi:hypothetical protein
MMKNFHEFVNEYLRKPEFTELMRRLGALGDGKQDQSESTIFAIWLLLGICKLEPKCKQHLLFANFTQCVNNTVLFFIIVPVPSIFFRSRLLMLGCVSCP